MTFTAVELLIAMLVTAVICSALGVACGMAMIIAQEKQVNAERDKLDVLNAARRAYNSSPERAAKRAELLKQGPGSL